MVVGGVVLFGVGLLLGFLLGPRRTTRRSPLRPPSARGSVIVSGGTIQEYGAQYPSDEPLCYPATYLRRTIAFEDSFFRLIGSEAMVTTAVPPSQL